MKQNISTTPATFCTFEQPCSDAFLPSIHNLLVRGLQTASQSSIFKVLSTAAKFWKKLLKSSMRYPTSSEPAVSLMLCMLSCTAPISTARKPIFETRGPIVDLCEGSCPIQSGCRLSAARRRRSSVDLPAAHVVLDLELLEWHTGLCRDLA